MSLTSSGRFVAFFQALPMAAALLLISLPSCQAGLRRSYPESSSTQKNRLYITGNADFDPEQTEKKFRRSGFRITDSVPHLNIWIAQFDTLATNPARMAQKLKKMRSVNCLEFERKYDPLDSREN
jgi:hypothetical protein